MLRITCSMTHVVAQKILELCISCLAHIHFFCTQNSTRYSIKIQPIKDSHLLIGIQCASHPEGPKLPTQVHCVWICFVWPLLWYTTQWERDSSLCYCFGSRHVHVMEANGGDTASEGPPPAGPRGVVLERTDNQPWGFRLIGGANFNYPFVVQNVSYILTAH